nr:DUF3307 domain-containing protein [uncultured Carboxylicivirga sp.]
MQIIVLLKLLLAHFIGDFIIQRDSWVRDRRKKGLKSIYLYLHIFIIALLSYLFLAQWHLWGIILLVFVLHLLIDIWKNYQEPYTFQTFFMDQILHLISIIFIWIILSRSHLPELFSNIENADKIWIYSFGYLFILWPCGIFIREFTAKWRSQLEKDGIPDTGLANAGKWIGYLERILVLTFILTGMYTSIGFLIAAKSLLRLNPKDEYKSRQFSEYILVGTLFSFTITILLGLSLKMMVKAI